MKIELGSKVRCIVSGYEGIAVSEVKYLNGCMQYCIAGKSIDNKPGESLYIDHAQLEVIGEGVIVTAKDTGGPNQYQPR